MHVALLGDSTFANAAYTEGGPDVVTYLGRLLDVTDGRATLLAVDGAAIPHVDEQLDQVRRMIDDQDAPTHLALSVGGNDLLLEIDVLREQVETVGAGLLAVRERARRFGWRYRALLDRVLELELPVVACTVYNGHFEEPREAAIIETAMRIFDHEILQSAHERGVPVIDLRRVCDQPEDYWNPIEPSQRGGEKIALAVAAWAGIGVGG